MTLVILLYLINMVTQQKCSLNCCIINSLIQHIQFFFFYTFHTIVFFIMIHLPYIYPCRFRGRKCYQNQKLIYFLQENIQRWKFFISALSLVCSFPYRLQIIPKTSTNNSLCSLKGNNRGEKPPKNLFLLVKLIGCDS